MSGCLPTVLPEPVSAQVIKALKFNWLSRVVIALVGLDGAGDFAEVGGLMQGGLARTLLRRLFPGSSR